LQYHWLTQAGSDPAQSGNQEVAGFFFYCRKFMYI